MPSKPVAAIYTKHVSDLLAGEYDRRKVLESRGDSIIKTSAALIALIAAITVYVLGKDYVVTNHWQSKWVLVASLACFVVSSFIAIFIQNWSLKLTVTGEKTLNGMTEDLWDLDEETAERMVLRRLVLSTISLRQGNKSKATAAQYAVILQVVAVGLFATAFVFELLG